MLHFSEIEVTKWADFYHYIFDQNSRSWVYRGQSKDFKLSTSIERALRGWDIDQKEAASIEWQTIREFRRRSREPQYQRVHEDTLFCLALMQHHGAPTRLLDCSYSPFVAAAFAMQHGFACTCPVIWCFNADWCEKEARKATEPVTLFDLRKDDKNRTDDTFLPLYQLGPSAPTNPRKFVNQENPFHLNERLTTQQGAFLCPADLNSSFEDNLVSIHDCTSENNLVKLRLKLQEDAATAFVQNLKSMNLSFAALFPGLDGFAKSIGQQIFHYHELAKQKAGE